MGRSKLWLPFGDETLLQRIVRRLSDATAPVLVVAAPRQRLPRLPAGVRVARDPAPGLGPLAGLATGLRVMEPLAPAAFVTSTDAPFLEPAFVRRLCVLFSDEHDAVIVQAAGRLHPLGAIYACRLHRRAAELLARGERQVVALLGGNRTRVVRPAELLADGELAAADPELRSLRNLNTPAQYRRALQDAGHRR
ncbi:MAG: molybdenum cofactor guanylyltransferase [Deltaproteobacteria bacterium]|nr:molybdenum cofactor guanylyltransferase [Deltaproteobacteria bacterium]